MSSGTASALIFLSVCLNFLLAWLLVRSLGKINDMKASMETMRKEISRHLHDPKPKKKQEEKPKTRLPLYMR